MVGAGPPRVEFGRRRVAPRVSIVDTKLFVRTFFAEVFEELGFVPAGCASAADLASNLQAIVPDLVLIVITGEEAGAENVLNVLAAATFPGKVILLGARGLPALSAMQRRGDRLGLAMLPALTTPFRTGDLAERLADLHLLPSDLTRSMPVDLTEALGNNWLELYYQPKVDPRSLSLCGAEVVIQLRHPTWGIVSPAGFVPRDGDPYCTALSDFIFATAIADWGDFAADGIPADVSVTLPTAVLGDPDFVGRVRRSLPHDPLFRLIIGIDGTEPAGDLTRARDTARELIHHNIGISIGSVNGEWSSIPAFEGFPLVEIKVDRALVHGSGRDRLKRASCATIVDLSRRLGIRAVAGGVDTRADFLAMREIGFDLVQGPLFGKPMKARKFARTLHVPTLPLPP
jgi:EAL domain-containing protein (putative c-di-GMP-specific phosphodiesterase class I)